MADRHAEQVAAKSAGAWRLAEGELLSVVDIEGGQTGDVFAVAADDLTDGLSSGRSFDYNESIRLTTGSVLYSRRSRPLLTIVDDEVGVHDFLYAPCSQEMYEIGYGATEPRPNCYDNMVAALGAFEVPAATVTIAFNVFMNVTVSEAGKIEILPSLSSVGKRVTFRAERDVLVTVTACPASNTNGGAARPFLVETSK